MRVAFQSNMAGDEQKFIDALEKHASRYGVQLEAATLKRLRDYYAHVSAWNGRLHLVAPCSPPVFATRHVLESLVALRYLKPGAHVVDVGSGAGLPIIPCLIARSDLRATLIEASPKKAIFLREALRRLNLPDAAQVITARFAETPTPVADYVTCRALEKFTEQLPQLVNWSPPSATLLLFGGPALRGEIESLGLSYHAQLMPESEQRFLCVVNRVPA